MRPVLLATVCLFAACAAAPLRTDHSPNDFDLRSLEGTWHVVGSTFPMWLDGKKTAPTFEYTNIDSKEGVVTMADKVTYLVKEKDEQKMEEILGTDTQSKTVPTHFTWRGVGAQSVITSEWDVVFVDPQGRFSIIAFNGTVVTPAGLDVISRSATISDSAWSDALGEINAWDQLRDRSKGITRL